MKWKKVKDELPNKRNRCYRILRVGREVIGSEYMYFNGALDEDDKVYDVDSTIGDENINQDEVEWLDESGHELDILKKEMDVVLRDNKAHREMFADKFNPILEENMMLKKKG